MVLHHAVVLVRLAGRDHPVASEASTVGAKPPCSCSLVYSSPGLHRTVSAQRCAPTFGISFFFGFSPPYLAFSSSSCSLSTSAAHFCVSNARVRPARATSVARARQRGRAYRLRLPRAGRQRRHAPSVEGAGAPGDTAPVRPHGPAAPSHHQQGVDSAPRAGSAARWEEAAARGAAGRPGARVRCRDRPGKSVSSGREHLRAAWAPGPCVHTALGCAARHRLPLMVHML